MAYQKYLRGTQIHNKFTDITICGPIDEDPSITEMSPVQSVKKKCSYKANFTTCCDSEECAKSLEFIRSAFTSKSS
jgi:hypothetical protein